MNYDVLVVEENGRNKAKGNAKRMMHANHKPTYDAKNRYGLPDDMPLSFNPLEKIYAGTVPVQKEKTDLNVDTPTEGIVEDAKEDIRDALLRAVNMRGITEDRFNEWLRNSARVAEDGTYMNLSGSMATNMINNIEQLAKVIGGK